MIHGYGRGSWWIYFVFHVHQSMEVVMKLNPPSTAVKGLPEGTLRTRMTHLEVGDVILVMTATADPHDFVKAAPTVAPKRAFWATVNVIGTSGIVVVAEDGDRIIITDCAPQTAVTIRDREAAVAAALESARRTGQKLLAAAEEAAPDVEFDVIWDAPGVAAQTATVPGCPDCVMPMMPGAVHTCSPFMLAARTERPAEVDFSNTDFALIADTQVILDRLVAAHASGKRKSFSLWSTRGKVKRSKANRPRKAMLGSVAA